VRFGVGCHFGFGGGSVARVGGIPLACIRMAACRSKYDGKKENRY
jgi:hypothetical protein